MAAVLFAKALAGGKKGFYRYNQNIAGIIISVSVPGTDVLQKTVVRVKLLCGVGECSVGLCISQKAAVNSFVGKFKVCLLKYQEPWAVV